ncbi:immunoglobulin-like domain-containing protein, partial [Thalassobellus citreus]|uniref:immunoglobulin-like domain-containing protein n=1 Tax=Thalassobellus citreus TaxID=3367752 RepID=UPI0037915F82
TYDILFEADCYQSLTLSNQTINDYQTINLADVLLTPTSSAVPTNLAASTTATTASISWNSTAGNTFDLRYREIGESTWIDILSLSSSPYNLSGLSNSTDYEVQVRSVCSGSTSAYTASTNFSTTAVNYCASASTNVNDEYISRVQLNTIDNTSNAQFYSDFTGVSTTLTKDSQYTITITPTWTGTVYNEAYSVWIDYNGNGLFTDAGEQVFNQAATNSTTVSGNFTIPTNALENSTRMRVSMQYNATPTSCQTFQYGEVEDYTIIIESSGPDIIPPTITLNGTSNIDLNLGDTYTELGATATDDEDGDITSNIITAGDIVNTNILGTYIITYNVSDAAGNAATEVTRTVNVIPDTTAPIITLIGSSTVNINIGGTYSEEGATASDNVDGDISSNIIIGGDLVNTNSVGTYIITYNVTDSSGNTATEVTRIVNVSVIIDTTAPIISLFGPATVNLNTGDIYTEQGATATDDIDGDITANIVIGGDTVNTNLAGTYVVTYSVNDAAGNPANQLSRTINITDPISGCSGGITSFPYSESFENTLGAWTQSSGDDIDWTVDASGTPSSNTGPSSATDGSYYIFVEASTPNYPSRRAIINSPCFDFSSLSEVEFSFSYHMYGAADMGTIDLEISNDDGDSWTSIWNQSGNQGNSWFNVALNLDSYAGENIQLRFNRFVGSTWQADIAIDNINLTGVEGNDTTAPVITLTGATSIDINAGDTYSELGATASDNKDGDISANIVIGGDTVNSNVAGTYIITYNVSDAAGNPATQVTRTVNVINTPTDVIIHEGYFESGWDGWSDGGSDCARRADAARSFEGNYSIRIRDNSGVASSMTSPTFDLSSFNEVEFNFHFYSNSMENGEDFWLQYNDGSGFVTIDTWARGTDFNNGAFGNFVVTLNASQYNLTGNAQFRLRCDASGNNDQIYIDQVIITGFGSNSASAKSSTSTGTEKTLDITLNEISKNELSLYPNPVKGDVLNIKLSKKVNVVSYRVINSLGQIVLTGKTNKEIIVDRLEAGTYFIEVNDGEQLMTKRFVKSN